MKIQLDTTNKTIKLDENVSLKELIKVLEGLLPKGLWKEFTLETNVIINNWSNPIIIKEYPSYPTHPIWWSTSGSADDIFLNNGTYNIELPS